MATAAALPGPGVASPGEAYSGSRKSAQRFEYAEHSTAGFVELAPSSFRAVSWDGRFVAAKDFYNALAQVLEISRGKELLPEHARAYARRAVARAGQRIPDDLLSTLQQGADAGEGPGSASPGGALASSSGPSPPKRSRCASPQRGPGTASVAPRAVIVPTATGAAASAYQFTRPIALPVPPPPFAAFA